MTDTLKCDEEKPRCRACNRRGRPCTYANDALNQLASVTSTDSSPLQISTGFSFTPIQYRGVGLSSQGLQNHGNIPRHSLQHQASPSAQNQQSHGATPNHISSIREIIPSPTSNASEMVLNMAHLELIYHFIASTSREISVSPSSHEVWNMTVPYIALSHEFLMHGLLATSASHIAHQRPEQRQDYQQRAAMHYNRADQLLQVAIAHPARQNADALFAFSLIMFYLTSAAPLAADKLIDEAPLSAAVHSISMLRGIRTILESVKHLVEQGLLAHLLRWYPGHIQSNPTFRDHETEEHFSKLLIFCSTTPDLNKDTEMEDVETYAAAASSLRASFLRVESVPEGEPNAPPIWFWAVRLPATFVERLKEQNVVPMVLLAHWCVILLQARHCWWVGSWVDRMMGAIEGCIPQEFRCWLGWPTRKIKESKEALRGAEGHRAS